MTNIVEFKKKEVKKVSVNKVLSYFRKITKDNYDPEHSIDDVKGAMFIYWDDGLPIFDLCSADATDLIEVLGQLEVVKKAILDIMMDPYTFDGE